MADLTTLMPLLTSIGIGVLILIGIAALFKAFYFKVEQGTALILDLFR